MVINLWKEKLKKHLFQPKRTDLRIKEGMALKCENMPKSLYKYKSFDDNGYSMKILKQNEIKLSIPEEFNDPFDCALTLSAKKIGNELMRQRLSNMIEKLQVDTSFTEGEIKKLNHSNQVIRDLAKIYIEKHPAEHEMTSDELAKILSDVVDEEFEDILSVHGNSIKTGIFITCFSETYKSILMWSHYSHYHEGFCIEYNFKELNHLHPLNRLIFPVFYTNSIFDATDFITQGKDGNLFMLTYAAINKSDLWSYEQEWRYVFQHGPTEEMQFVSVPKPKAVYLGTNILNENKEKILEIAEQKDFEVYQMNMEQSEYALKSERIL